MRSFSLPAFLSAHRRTLIVIVGIALIPLIYAGSLIWSNEDPTHRLDHINAAIVNSDEAATPASATGGTPAEPVDLGATLTEKLVESTESNNFSWHEMTADEAQSALESGQVLAVLEIPAGFSAAAVSAGSEDPLDAAIARLSITTNDGANIIVGNIASTVGTTVADELSAQVSDEYLRNVYVGFTSIHDSVTEAADGASQLNDGAEQARTGSGELVVGLAQLREGGLALADGSATLAEGATQVDAGVQQLNTGAATLDAGAQQLSAGAASANNGAQQLSTGATTVNEGAQALSTNLGSAASGAQLLSDGLAQLNGQTSELPTKLAELVGKVTDLNDGASGVSNGANEALAGATTLNDNAVELSASTAQLSTGLDSLLEGWDSMPESERKTKLDALATSGRAVNSGASALSGGLTGLVGDPSSKMGLSSLAPASGQLAARVGSIADGVSPLSGKLDELVTAVSTAATTSSELSAGVGQLASGASTLATGTQSLADGASTLATGTQSLADGASTLASGTQTLAAGASTLAQSTPVLASGATELSTGASTLAAGTVDAESGGTKLNDGITQLANGSRDLASGLDDGVADIPSYSDAQAEHLAGVTSSPVEITKNRLNEVPAYGYGLAPYFMTLGLWVGALAFYLMFPPLRDRLVLSRQPAIVVALRSFAPGAMIGAVQSLLMLTIVRFGLGLQPADTLGLVALALLTSVTFIAVNQAFNALLGPPGRFLALIMIVLQLSSAGGTYPVETAPAFFQLIHSWLPLNYAVTAFRSLVAGGSIGIGEAYGMLSVWLLAALALTTLSVVLKRRGQRLTPAQAAPDREARTSSAVPVAG